MRPIRLSLCAAVGLALLLAACGDPPAPEAQPLTLATDAAEPSIPGAEPLRVLFDDEWQRRLKDNPTLATYLGEPRYNDRWENLDPKAIEARQAEDRIALDKLGALSRASLSAEDQLNYDLFQRDLEDRIEGQSFRPELMPLSQLDGVQLGAQLLEFTPFATVKDYENWLARLQGFDTLVDQTIALMRRGIVEKRLRPRIVMQRVLPQIAPQIVTRAEDSPFYAPFKNYPESVAADVRTQLDLAGQAAILEVVVPAFQRLYTFVDKEYIPACPENEMGLSAQPRGAEYYAWLVRHHTTTRLSVDEIHDRGLREVERLRGEIDTLMRGAGHKGGVARFKEKLSWNPRYQYDDAGLLLDGYRAIAKRIDPELPRLFGKLPRTPYGVRALPELVAPSAPAGYYYPPSADGLRAGYFYVNTWQPGTRSGWEMEALTAHEAVPGHHLQVAIANELEGLPAFRRHGLELSAFVEGWGLYAESLGGELGLYQDVGSRFGKLSFEMWRAARLVVDTGLHAKGWTRKKAREYLAAQVPKSEAEIAVEVDRYIAMPGQALAYKIGAMKISELRARAQSKLGERFDVRAFHDAVLGSGPLPLDQLEKNIDAWIEAQPKS